MRTIACLLAALLVCSLLHAQLQPLKRKTSPTATGLRLEANRLHYSKARPIKLPVNRRLTDGYTLSNHELKDLASSYRALKTAKEASFWAGVAGSAYGAIYKTQNTSPEGIQKTLNVLGFYPVKPGLRPSFQARFAAQRLRRASFLRGKVLRPMMYFATAAAVWEIYKGINAGKNLQSRAIISGERSRVPVDRSDLR